MRVVALLAAGLFDRITAVVCSEGRIGAVTAQASFGTLVPRQIRVKRCMRLMTGSTVSLLERPMCVSKTRPAFDLFMAFTA